MNLDFRRFVSRQTKEFMNAEIDAIREVCPDIPVTTNMMPAFYELNYYDLAEELDVISWDSYPDWHNGSHLEMALEKPWAEPMAEAMVGIAIAVLVHVVYCIWNECYFSMNEEPKKVLIFFGVISVSNVIIAVMQGLEGELIENGTLTNQCANLVVAIMFGFIMIALAIKNATRKEEED